MSLLETSRGMEAVAYLQRTLNRYPGEAEVVAFAASLYQSLGDPSGAITYWSRLSEADRETYSSESFVVDKLHWGPKAIQGLRSFLSYNNIKSLK